MQYKTFPGEPFNAKPWIIQSCPLMFLRSVFECLWVSKPKVFGENLVFFSALVFQGRLGWSCQRAVFFGHGNLRISFVRSAFRKCLLLRKQTEKQCSLVENIFAYVLQQSSVRITKKKRTREPQLLFALFEAETYFFNCTWLSFLPPLIPAGHPHVPMPPCLSKQPLGWPCSHWAAVWLMPSDLDCLGVTEIPLSRADHRHTSLNNPDLLTLPFLLYVLIPFSAHSSADIFRADGVGGKKKRSAFSS